MIADLLLAALAMAAFPAAGFLTQTLIQRIAAHAHRRNQIRQRAICRIQGACQHHLSDTGPTAWHTIRDAGNSDKFPPDFSGN
jgi:hypothetical protein